MSIDEIPANIDGIPASTDEIPASTDEIPGSTLASSFVVLSISGRGFLYHMCRKIVGVCLAALAGLVPALAIPVSFDEKRKICTPTAPG